MIVLAQAMRQLLGAGAEFGILEIGVSCSDLHGIQWLAVVS